MPEPTLEQQIEACVNGASEVRCFGLHPELAVGLEAAAATLRELQQGKWFPAEQVDGASDDPRRN